MKRNLLSLFIILMLVVSFTSGCSKFDEFRGVGKKDKTKATGERIPILERTLELKEDAELANKPIELPEAWRNNLWPQSGGYPNRAMGQLELGNNLKKVWSAYIGSKDVSFNPLTVQPIAVNDSVYTLDNRSQLSAYDLRTGKMKWRFAINPPGEERATLGGGIAYSNGRLYATSGYRLLLCINPENGKLIWSKKLPSPARSAPTVSSGRIYITSLDNHLMTFSEENGEMLWTYSGIKSNTNLLGAASPTVDPSLVVLPLSTGEVIGLRPENGQVVWHDNIAAVSRTETLFTISDIRAQPVIDQGIVYASSYSGRMVALDAITGRRLWQQQIGATEMPWSAGDVIYVIDNNQRLIAMHRMTGRIYWIKNIEPEANRKKNNNQVWKGPILAGGRLILTSNTGKVLEINAQNGELIRRFKTNDGVIISPLIANGTLLLLTEDGELVAYR